MLFGWAVEHGVTSNSVLYVKDGCTVGIGTGEQDRVGVAEIAVHKAYIKYADILCFDTTASPMPTWPLGSSRASEQAAEQDAIDAGNGTDRGGLPGSVMISDAFFPFRTEPMSASGRASPPSCRPAAPCTISRPSRPATKQSRRWP